MTFFVPRTPREVRSAAIAETKELAERSLYSYLQLVWKTVEPGNPLRLSWALRAVSDHLQAVSEGKIRKLLINLPPGFSKSLLTDSVWPSWEWGPRGRGDLRILSWSYAETVVKINMGRCRRIIGSPIYRALWGDRFKIDRRRDSLLEFHNDRLGFMLGSTVDGQTTGLRGDRLIVDDPHDVKGADSDAQRQRALDWFAGALTTRVRNANAQRELVDGLWAEPSTTVVIMQRLHRQDISGLIIDGGLDFEHLLIEMDYEGVDHPARRSVHFKTSSIGYVDPREAKLAAIDASRATFFQLAETRGTSASTVDAWWDAFGDLWARIARDVASLAWPQRFNRPAVEEAKKILARKQGTNAVRAQFRQWPGEEGGTLFARDQLGRYVDRAPLGTRDDCRGWDFAASDAASADRTACVKLRMDAQGRIFVLDAIAVRRTPAGVEDLIRRTADADGATTWHSFPQDPGAAGKHVIHNLARHVLQGRRFESSPEMKKKTIRAEPFAAQVEHGNVYLVRGDWNRELVDELVEFPHGLHDDLVDACVRAYDALLRRPTTAAPTAPELFT
jgi:predicted phage terminase large subunit-like protein